LSALLAIEFFLPVRLKRDIKLAELLFFRTDFSVWTNSCGAMGGGGGVFFRKSAKLSSSRFFGNIRFRPSTSSKSSSSNPSIAIAYGSLARVCFRLTSGIEDVALVSTVFLELDLKRAVEEVKDDEYESWGAETMLWALMDAESCSTSSIIS
jgi:hypothetical protein